MLDDRLDGHAVAQPRERRREVVGGQSAGEVVGHHAHGVENVHAIVNLALLHFKDEEASQGFGKGADVILSANGKELARGPLPGNMLMPAGGGETLDIGRDIGVTVTDYATRRGVLEGDVPHLSIDFD